MNSYDYAKNELERIGMLDGNPYNESVSASILELIDTFSEQGHSGFTASYTIRVFSRLASFKPLAPLTGEDDEWTEISHGLYQNKRYTAVFKDGKDGKAYNIEGKIFTDDGETWFTSKNSKVYIEFPYEVPDEPEEIYLKKED